MGTESGLFKMLNREQVIRLCEEGVLTWTLGASTLGLSVRQLRRLKHRYSSSGFSGLADGRGRKRGSTSSEVATRMCALKRGMYSDYSVSHFYDVAVDEHGLKKSYSWLLRTLQNQGVVKKIPRRGTYRRRRPRQPMVGLRVHTDGSTHPWLGTERPVWDLVIMLDDADGRLLAARFVPEESVLSTMWILEEVLLKYGRFSELYHDRGSMYVTTTNASQGPNTKQNGQVTRALGELGIKQRWAYSPQARGRCERAFGTIQGRLCAELKTKKIEDYDTANAYLQDVFISDFNKRFTVTPERDESAFAPIAMKKAELRIVLSQQQKRQVKNDYTIQWDRQILQLPKPKDNRVLVKKKVTVHQMHEGTIAVSHQNKILAYFKADRPWHQLQGFTKHEPLLARPLEPPPLKYHPQIPKLLNDHLNTKNGPIIQRKDLFYDSQLPSF